MRRNAKAVKWDKVDLDTAQIQTLGCAIHRCAHDRSAKSIIEWGAVPDGDREVVVAGGHIRCREVEGPVMPEILWTTGMNIITRKQA